MAASGDSGAPPRSASPAPARASKVGGEDSKAVDSSAAASADDGASSPWARELRKNWPLHAVFSLGGLMLLLVNKAELIFARSLVECETPVDSGGADFDFSFGFTGSARCGDRVLVIAEGQRLSSTGQGQECFFKVLSMVFVAVFADVVGRKPALLVGLSCTAASAALFFVAASSPQWLAFRLFALGQGLQGAYPTELLCSIVASDISNEPGSDALAVSGLAGFLGFLVNFFAEIVGVLLNVCEITDFRCLWALALAANLGLAIAAGHCRETRPTFKDQPVPRSILSGVAAELREYTSLLFGNSLLRLNLAQYACLSFLMCSSGIDFSWYMSQHSMPQDSIARSLFLCFPIGVFCFGWPQGLCQKVGMVRGFTLLLLATKVIDLVLLPLYPLHWSVFLVHHYLLAAFAGLATLSEAIDKRWFDQRLTAKFFSMKGLTLYIVGMVANPVYAASFDARASSYTSSMAPYGLRTVASLAQLWLLFGPIWHAEGGLPVVLKRIEDEAVAAPPPAAEAKKTD